MNTVAEGVLIIDIKEYNELVELKVDYLPAESIGSLNGEFHIWCPCGCDARYAFQGTDKNGKVSSNETLGGLACRTEFTVVDNKVVLTPKDNI